MAILAMISIAFENSVSESFHFQRLAGVEDACISMGRGTRIDQRFVWSWRARILLRGQCLHGDNQRA